MIVAAESSAGKERKDRIAVVTGFGHCSVGVAGSDSVCYLLHAVKNRIGYRIRRRKPVAFRLFRTLRCIMRESARF